MNNDMPWHLIQPTFAEIEKAAARIHALPPDIEGGQQLDFEGAIRSAP